MSYLVVGSGETAVTVPVRIGGPRARLQPVGNVRPAFSGVPRSRVRDYFKAWEVETQWMTRTEADTLVAQLTATPPITITGDMAGSVTAVPENIREIETERLVEGGVNTEHVRLGFDLLEDAAL